MSVPPGIAIYDYTPRGCLAFGLVDLLDVLERDVATSIWVCSDLECTGDDRADLEAAADAHRALTTPELRSLADRVHQIIWGTFDAFRDGTDAPWMRIRAIDSSFFVVFSVDDAPLQRLRLRFHTIRPAEPRNWDSTP